MNGRLARRPPLSRVARISSRLRTMTHSPAFNSKLLLALVVIPTNSTLFSILFTLAGDNFFKVCLHVTSANHLLRTGDSIRSSQATDAWSVVGPTPCVPTQDCVSRGKQQLPDCCASI